jgi:hypothetical protein
LAVRNRVLAIGQDSLTGFERFTLKAHEIVQIDPLKVSILCLNQAERNQEIILRIFIPDMIGKEIPIRSTLKPITSAAICNTWEMDIQPLKVYRNTLYLTINKAITTIQFS